MSAPTAAEVQAPFVVRSDVDGIATLTLSRGDRLNPLSSAMLGALQSALDEVAGDASVRVVILAGAGKHFCAGHDLREMRSHPDKAWQSALFEQCGRVMMSLVRLPQPVIARVQGVAVAAGCQLVSMCDLAVAAADARFALPGINNGIFCTTPGVGVARSVARKHALEMLFTGDLIDAATAERWVSSTASCRLWSSITRSGSSHAGSPGTAPPSFGSASSSSTTRWKSDSTTPMRSPGRAWPAT